MTDPVRLTNVTRTYGSVTALRDFSLNVRSGELLALLGPNGAGKSTLVSLMLGLRPPTRGEVRVHGADPR
ncbi:ATP-binding cassette domain-containing protein, partial [Deinococcus pimensis]|uniref:ATP-binding cassette domain-containing protein n=1 Tax=Deinococcus pimensis TaxID=309888 RepID=UPI0005EB095D